MAARLFLAALATPLAPLLVPPKAGTTPDSPGTTRLPGASTITFTIVAGWAWGSRVFGMGLRHRFRHNYLGAYFGQPNQR